MDLTDQHKLRLYLLWLVIFGLIALAALMVLPLVNAIVSAFLLAYIARPLYLKLTPKLSPSHASLVCTLTALFLIVVPICLIGIVMISQAGDFFSHDGIIRFIDVLLTNPFMQQFNLNADVLLVEITKSIDEIVNASLLAIPLIALNLLIALMGMYYILSKWQVLSIQLKKYLPFSNKEKISSDLDKTTGAIIYGTLFIAVLEFFIAFIGFAASGVQANLIFAVIVFVLAFIPSIGPLMVWFPLAIYYFSIQEYTIALGVTITGLILTVGVEFILYTKLIGDRSKIHPFVMLIGVIGGVSLFGIFGFILGPVLLANALKLVEDAVGAD